MNWLSVFELHLHARVGRSPLHGHARNPLCRGPTSGAGFLVIDQQLLLDRITDGLYYFVHDT